MCSKNILFNIWLLLGFPVDLTQIMATEKGFTVDLDGFQSAMLAQKERGRTAGIYVHLDIYIIK